VSVVAAFLLPALPHPVLRPDVAPWGRLAAAARVAGERLAAARADTLVFYSTQWIAVLDQLWQARPRLTGTHVDENWYDWGDLSFDMQIDLAFTNACIAQGGDAGFKSKAVNYDGFPIDTGSIVAQRSLNPRSALPLVITSNNLYHDWDRTERLGRLVRDVARERRVAVVGIGGLSQRMFRHEIDPASDRIADAADEARDRALLAAFESGDADRVRATAQSAAQAMPTEYGLKHVAFLLGAAEFNGATVHGYEPVYGTGAAVVELTQ
jgi:2-aminophenol/2-amino-5-chlorophenol 1,6-dioxygenase subunit alpha